MTYIKRNPTTHRGKKHNSNYFFANILQTTWWLAQNLRETDHNDKKYLKGSIFISLTTSLC